MDPLEALGKEINKALHKAGVTLVSDIRKNLNVAQPYKRTGSHFRGFEPSRPGDFPKKLSGQLLKSVAYVVDEKEHVATVGTNIKYGRWLEFGTSKMQPRPWLIRTYTESAPKLAKFFGGA